MTTEKPRTLVHLAVEGFKAALDGDHAKSNAIIGEVGLRAYQMSDDSQPIPESEIQPGDWLKVRQGLKFHHGVVIDDSKIVHATTKHGVISTSIATFANGRELRLVSRVSPEQREAVIELVKDSIGRPYDVLRANCEHLASLAHNGKATSYQVEVGGFFAVLLAELAVVAAVSPGEKKSR